MSQKRFQTFFSRYPLLINVAWQSKRYERPTSSQKFVDGGVVKVKFTIEQATKAQKGRCIALLFL
jgi:hypothetical protein